jgi:hypothetical protein
MQESCGGFFNHSHNPSKARGTLPRLNAMAMYSQAQYDTLK